METIVVTSGERWVDIDAVACAIAYTELLNLLGRNATAVLPGLLNNSVTPFVRALGLSYETTCPPNPQSFVLVDISNSEFFAECVDLARVTEIFDHHSGFEAYWRERLGEKAQIEMIGACATFIWEAYLRRGMANRISPCSAALLAIAIVSNTLNFNLPLTSERDLTAYQQLLAHAQLPSDWLKNYSGEQDAASLADPAAVVLNDTKEERVPGLDRPLVIGQLELWDGKSFSKHHRNLAIAPLRNNSSPYWLLHTPSISEKRSYLITEHPQVQALLKQRMGTIFHDNTAVLEPLVLRKMILKSLQ